MNPLVAYRKRRGLTQLACAQQLGLKSKSYISGIENGSMPASLRLALKIEQWSGGEVPARAVVHPDAVDLLPATSVPEARP